MQRELTFKSLHNGNHLQIHAIAIIVEMLRVKEFILQRKGDVVISIILVYPLGGTIALCITDRRLAESKKAPYR